MTVLGMHTLTLEQDLNEEYNGPELAEIVGEIELLSCQLDLLSNTEKLMNDGLSLEAETAVERVLDAVFGKTNVTIGDRVYTTEPNPLSLESVPAAYTGGDSRQLKKEGVGSRILKVIAELIKRVMQAGKAAADFIGRMFSTSKQMDKRFEEVMKTYRAEIAKSSEVGPGEMKIGQQVSTALLTKPRMSVDELTRVLQDTLGAYNGIMKGLYDLFSLQAALAVEGKRIAPAAAKSVFADFNKALAPLERVTLAGNQKPVTIDRGFGVDVLSSVLEVPNMRFALGFEGDRITEGTVSYTPRNIEDLEKAYKLLGDLQDQLKKSSGIWSASKRFNETDLMREVRGGDNESRAFVHGLYSVPTHRLMSSLSREVFRIERGIVMLAEAMIADMKKGDPDSRG